MHILIPYDVTTTGMNNPYLYLLLRELVKNNRVEKVTYGYGWLNEQLDIDIIHLHWPELLIKSGLTDMSRVDLLTPENFSKSINTLKRWKSNGTRIITTVHNEKPHNDSEGLFSEYYGAIYDLSDGFIHMGKSSEILINKQFKKETENKPGFVIPHGNYDFFPSDRSRDYCRKKIHVNEDQKLLLSFGAVRSERELNLGIDAFFNASVQNSMYMVAGKLPYPYKSQWKHFSVRKKLYRYSLNNRIKTVEKIVSPNDVQLYLKAADLLFIPRFNTLNSGNVALGFTFGKVVIGPDYGVIGEVLKETGNPVFNPTDLSDVSRAIQQGFEMSKGQKGVENRSYASEYMNWNRIADKTVDAYHNLLSNV